MSSEKITALNNALVRIAQERQQKQTEIVRCQEAVDRAQANVQDAEKRAECAAYGQRLVEKDVNALLDLYNSSTEKPQALLPQIDRLQKDQAEKYRESQAANGAVQQRQQALRETQIRLGVAREAHDTMQAQWQEISDLLQREMNQ